MAVAVIAAAIGCADVYGVPADPRPRTFTQPDGTTITVKLRGDERTHFYLSEDDHLLVRKGDAFYYGDIATDGSLKASTMIARPAEKRTAAEIAYLNTVDMQRVYSVMSRRSSESKMARAPQRGPGLFPGTGFPSKGQQKALVILVQYQDVAFTLDDPHDYFSRLLMQPGFSDYGGTGSAHDYFIDNSNGQFDPQFDLVGPVTLAHNRSYYGGNDIYGNDNHPEEMVIEACQQLDNEIDFAQYDRDNDGYIDNVFVFYAGQGEASYGGSDTVWPHSWEVSAATSTAYNFDGKRLDRYACSNEWESGRPDGVGTFVHEFSHVMGLPDLYATSYTNAFTPGAWSALDYGPYNNDGCTPPCYGAFERYALGWIEPTVLGSPLNARLSRISTNKAYMIPTSDPDEFFLLENRQQTGWDAYIPGHGMLIWHVDYESYIWNSNTVNNSSSHQYVDIEEADNTRNEYSRDGDAFPGASGVTEFTDDTNPSMRTWSGASLNVPITEITEVDGVIRFKVCGGLPDIAPVTVNEPTDITATGFKISWSAVENAQEYHLCVYTKKTVGTREYTTYVGDYNHKNVGKDLSADITGLEPLTEYFCMVYGSNGIEEGEGSNEIAVTTADPTFDLITPVVEDASDVNADWFYANWQPVEGATDYIINVYTKVRAGEPQADGCDFTGGLPSGWTSTTKQTFANAAYSGREVPSLRMTKAGDYVQTPVYNDDICEVSFWHRGSNTSESNTITVKAYVNKSWIDLTKLNVKNVAGGVVTTITAIPEGTRSIRIYYNEETDKGSLAIDDINVGWGRQLVNRSFGKFTDYHTGNVTTCMVDGTNKETTYYYTVKATDGDLFTRVSGEKAVTTASTNSGISDVAVGTYTVSGRTIYVDQAPGTAVQVCDITGRVMASGKTGGDGKFTATLPARGVYVVKIGNKASKISI